MDTVPLSLFVPVSVFNSCYSIMGFDFEIVEKFTLRFDSTSLLV